VTVASNSASEPTLAVDGGRRLGREREQVVDLLHAVAATARVRVGVGVGVVGRGREARELEHPVLLRVALLLRSGAGVARGAGGGGGKVGEGCRASLDGRSQRGGALGLDAAHQDRQGPVMWI